MNKEVALKIIRRMRCNYFHTSFMRRNDEVECKVLKENYEALDFAEESIQHTSELLEVLEKILDEYCHVTNHEYSVNPEELPEVIRARKAIAKARGEK